MGTLNGFGLALPNADLLVCPLYNRDAITPSSIESTYVTAEQLLLYELASVDAISADGNVADWNEVHQYRAASTQGCELIEGAPQFNKYLLQMHRRLMQGVRGAGKSPGEFRRVQVELGATGRFIPAPPSKSV